MQRYEYYKLEGRLFEDNLGNWVLWEDVEETIETHEYVNRELLKMLQQQQREMARLRKQITLEESDG
jgi:hypothetical protein